MKYMLLIYGDERKLTQAEMDQIYAGHRAYGEAMTKAGVMRGGAELKPAQATTVRFRGGKPGAKMDGPFAETKEQLGGYHVVECRDLDEAIAIAQRIPTIAIGGVVEVRPVEGATH